MTNGLNIAFFGTSLASPREQAAAAYHRGILGALAARGHRVTSYVPDERERPAHHGFEDTREVRVVAYAPTEADARRVLEAAAAADVIVNASDGGALDGFLERAIPDVRRPGALAVFWDVDAAATLARLRERPDDAFVPLVARYDVVFVDGGGDPVVAAYRDLGARTCVRIPAGIDPATNGPGRSDPKFACDLAFVGDHGTGREARIDEFFLRAAVWAPSRSFLLGGAGWESRAVPPNVRRLGHVFLRDHEALDVTPLAVLDVSRENVAQTGWSPDPRMFATAAAGGCIITDAAEGIEDFFEPGSEVLLAHDGSRVASHVEHLTRARAREFGSRARARVLADHTWACRARDVEAVLEGRLERATRRTGIAVAASDAAAAPVTAAPRP